MVGVKTATLYFILITLEVNIMIGITIFLNNILLAVLSF